MAVFSRQNIHNSDTARLLFAQQATIVEKKTDAEPFLTYAEHTKSVKAFPNIPNLRAGSIFC